MMAEFGHFTLILALMMALIQGTLPLIGASRNIKSWMLSGLYAGRAQFLFLSLSFGSLISCFIQNDFSVLYVAEHSNSDLPLYYRIAATWGAHEGSMLLWATILAFWTLMVSSIQGSLSLDFHARVMGIKRNRNKESKGIGCE